MDRRTSLKTMPIKRKVYKERARFGALGYRAKGYRRIRSDGVRVKNRLKILYRSRGVPVAGRGVYTVSKRGEYLHRLPKQARPLAEVLCQELDGLEALTSEAKKAMLTEAKRHAEFRLVKNCPGLGPVRTAELLPIVVTPYRFQSKRGFWSHCGLGNVTRSSSDWVRTQSGEWKSRHLPAPARRLRTGRRGRGSKATGVCSGGSPGWDKKRSLAWFAESAALALHPSGRSGGRLSNVGGSEVADGRPGRASCHGHHRPVETC
jgi:hypothetical protein